LNAFRKPRIWQKLLGVALTTVLLSACAGSPGPVGNSAVPQPAKAVELNRYLGRWYEMARYEAPFQKGCEGVTADYSLRDDGKIKVVNSCRKDGISGKVREASGKAKVVDGSNGAKLKVSFFGPFYGDYWVLDRAEDYSWSIVGEPSGRYLWILTREAKPDAATRAMLEARVRALGYDWSLVRVTQH
jgi:apolipoprotein D and lipocalin family protein